MDPIGNRLPDELIRWKVEVSRLTMVGPILTHSWSGSSRAADTLVGPSRTIYFIWWMRWPNLQNQFWKKSVASTLENILELLQIRFGNKSRLDNFHAQLKRRKRISRRVVAGSLFGLVSTQNSGIRWEPRKKYPEIYFRNLFIDALGDRELRRAVLIQNLGTMEVASHVAIRLEQSYAYTRLRYGTEVVENKLLDDWIQKVPCQWLDVTLMTWVDR